MKRDEYIESSPVASLPRAILTNCIRQCKRRQLFEGSQQRQGCLIVREFIHHLLDAHPEPPERQRVFLRDPELTLVPRSDHGIERQRVGNPIFGEKAVRN